MQGEIKKLRSDRGIASGARLTSLKHRFIVPFTLLAILLSFTSAFSTWHFLSGKALADARIDAHSQQANFHRLSQVAAQHATSSANALGIALANDAIRKSEIDAALISLPQVATLLPVQVGFASLEADARASKSALGVATLTPYSERFGSKGLQPGWTPVAGESIAPSVGSAAHHIFRTPVITPDRRHIGWFDAVYASDQLAVGAPLAFGALTGKPRAQAIVATLLAGLIPLILAGFLLAVPLFRVFNDLMRLALAAERFKLGAPLDLLPIQRRDELGRVARAIASMSHQASAMVNTERSKTAIGAAVSDAQQEAIERQQAALARSMEQVRQFAAVVEAAYEGIVILDRRFRIEYANPAFGNDFKMPTSTLKGLRISELFHPETKDSIDQFEPVLDLGIVVRETVRCKRADSVELYAELTASPVRDDEGVITGIVIVERDVTASVMSSELMTRQLLIDPLTEVWRRTALITDMERRASRPEQTTFSVLFIDLDGFKLINDRFGHDAGDTVLRAVGAVLRSQIRENDVAGRYGGDEFIIVVDDDAKESNARRIAQRVVAAIPTVTGLRYPDVRFSASVGIACFPRDADTVTDVVRCADHAMYAAKRAGGSRCVSWTDVKTKPSWNSTLPSAEVLTLRRRG